MSAIEREIEEVRKTEIRLVVHDYFKDQLKQKGFIWTPSHEVNELLQHSTSLTEVRRGILTEYLNLLTNEMNEKFRQKISQMCEKIGSDLYVISDIDYDLFKGIGDGLFSEGIKWCHIVSLLVLCSELAYMKGGLVNSNGMVNKIFIHMTEYMCKGTHDWIFDHDGWDGLVTYANNRQIDFPSRSFDNVKARFKQCWTNSNLIKISAAVGAISVAAALVSLFVTSKN